MSKGAHSAWIAGLLLAAPWVIPFGSWGPSPSVIQWLICLTCVGLFVSVVSFGGVAAPLQCFTGRGWLFASVISSAFALIQYFDAENHFSPWLSVAGPGESFANLRQRNQFATLTNIGLLALMWLVAVTNSKPKSRGLWLFTATAILLSAGNASSASRTGLIQLGMLVGIAWLWGGLRRTRAVRVIVAASLLGYVGATVGLPLLAGLDLASSGMLGRLQDRTPACASRWILWGNVLNLISQKPWFGWGWGELDYAHYMTLYPGSRFCDILDNAHNLPLHLAVELGIPFAMASCAIAGWIVWRAAPWRETDLTRQMAWGVLSVIMLHSMLEYPLWYGPFQVALGQCVWLLLPASQTWAVRSRETARATTIRAVFTAALLTATAYAAWDYHRISQIYLAPQARDTKYRDDTLEKIRVSWLFRNQVRFAELTTIPLGRPNAQWTFETANTLLHFSPEPRVVEKVIESAVMLGHDEDALFHLVRYRIAFPTEHAKWRSANVLDGRAAN